MKKELSIEEIILRWAWDSEAFVREALRVDTVSTQQVEALRAKDALVKAKLAVAEYDRGLTSQVPTDEERALALKKGLSIQSGQGSGKDAYTAWNILHDLICFPNVKIPTTAPTQHQLRDILWAEVHKWMRHSQREHKKAESGYDICEWITWGADRIYQTDLKGREWFAVARTCNTKATAEEQAETLAGFHEDYLTIVVDEASGVPDPVFKPLEGTMTGLCNYALIIFNPTRNTGFAIETQREDRQHWICLHWNCEESELVSQEHIDYMRRKYGVESNTYRIRVLGLPPKADPDVLIPWDWVMGAVDRDLVPGEDDPEILGIDVARTGEDKSILLSYRGGVVTDVQEFKGLDTEELSNWAMGIMFDREPTVTLVDVIGIGAGVTDKLQHRVGGMTIIGVNVSEISSNDQRFFRLRDELWWRLRELFEQRVIRIPDDAELIGELTTPKYKYLDRGQIKIESKRDMKLRGIPSPNKADALCLCMYYEQEHLRKMRGRTSWRRDQRAGVSWRTA